MYKRLRSVFILILALVFALSVLGLAATTARYVSSPSATVETTDDLDGELNYSLSQALVIYNVDQLKAAVQNGYSYIQIHESVANPLFVSGDELDVTSDLVLDLNGHEIQRNDRNPMLNVTEGVKLTILDSGGGGSMYNPVGSVLNITGGTLNVQAGIFESGPRKNEHYSNYSLDPLTMIKYNGNTGTGTYKGGVINSDAYTSDTNLQSGSAQVTVTTNTHANGELTGSTTETKYMPIILPQTITTTTTITGVDIETLNGSIYFDNAYTDNSCNIAADTYLYVVMEGAESRYISVEGAQFSYSYYVTENTNTDYSVQYSYAGTTSTGGGTLVTVYGYENVKTAASDSDPTGYNNTGTSYNNTILGRDTSNFAAIKMQSGTFNVKDGSYYSYFGEDTSYCVSATGGALNITSGTFEAIEEGVCVRSAADGTSSGNGTVVISGGEFYSFKGDMAQVVDGTITVTGGTFTKDATKSCTDTNYTTTGYSSGVSEDGANNSAIDLDGGTMTVSNTEITLNGSGVNGIKCQSGSSDGTVTVSNSTFTYNGGGNSDYASSDYSYNVGIVNYGGTIEATDCLFDTNDSYTKGIKSESGEVTANGCYFVLSGSASTGIQADGGTVEIGKASDVANTICMFYIDHVNACYGIYSSTSTDITLKVNAAQFIMGQKYYSNSSASVPSAYTESNGTGIFNSAGIYLNATDDSEVILKRAVFMMAGNYSAGVYAAKGKITQTGTDSDGYTSAFLIGVEHSAYNGNGKYNSNYGGTSNTFNISKTFISDSTAVDYFVAMYGSNTGSTYTASTSYYTLGTTTSLTTLSSQFEGLSATGTTIGSYGIFSQGGTITAANVYVALCSTYGSGIYTSGGTMNITSFQCDVRSTDSTATAYPGKTGVTADVSSSAIASGSSSSNASIMIGKSTINTDAYGFNIKSGTLTFTDTNTLVSARATAIYVSGASLTINNSATLNVTSNIATTSGWNTKTYDTTKFLTDYTNLDYTSTSNSDTIQPDGIYVSGGSLTSSGTLNVTFSGVESNASVATHYDVGTTTTYQGGTVTGFKMTSYAVRVAGTSSPTVTITSGAITSSIGGGIDVSATGATVYLGVEDETDQTKFTVSTTGTAAATNDYYTKTAYMLNGSVYNFTTSNVNTNWQYRLYPQSGNAVKVDSGTLTIYSGTYTTVQGNGIYVNGSSSTVDIYNGYFLGREEYLSSNVGPGISYAVKLFDGTLRIWGGNFGIDGTNTSNGVLILGQSAPSNSSLASSYSCQGYFYSGSYTGTRAVTIMGYCYAQFGSDYGHSPTVTGTTYAIGMEAMANTVDYSLVSLFVMKDGAVSATSDGIWIGNSKCDVTITGGSVQGSSVAVRYYVATDSNLTVYGATITGATGIYFTGAMSGTTTIGSTSSSITTSINTTEYGIRYNSTVSGAVNIKGTINGSTYTTTIFGTTGGVLFGSGVAEALTISAASISGETYGLCFGGASSANITISDSSKVYVDSGGNGIRFTSSAGVFTGDYTFTIDNSLVYGGAGIRWFNVTTGTYGTFKICNGATVKDRGSYQALQFDSTVGMSIVIDGSSTEVYGGNCAIQFGSSATLSGSITISGGAKLYNTKSSTTAGVINFEGSEITGDITMTGGSTISGYDCGIYIAVASSGNITITNSTINITLSTASLSNGLYFANTMSGALTITSSTITSYYNAIHFYTDGTSTTSASATGGVTITSSTITSTAGDGVHFGVLNGAITITGTTITAGNGAVSFSSSYSTGNPFTTSGSLVIDGSSSLSGAYGLYFNVGGTGTVGSVTISGSATVAGTTYGIYATGNFNISITIESSATVIGGQHAIYITSNLNNDATITLYSNTALINGSSYYQIYVGGTNSGTITCSEGNVTVNSSSYTG